MSQKVDNYTFLTTRPVGHVISTMAVPTIISMLVTSIYNVVDTFYVGRINTQATAAVGIVLPMMAVIQAFGFFFGQGSGTFISRSLGARQTGDAKKMANTAVTCSFLFGCLITVFGLLFLKPLSVALGSTPTILPYTEDFLGVILLGAPFQSAALTLNNQIRFQGNAAYSMIGIVAGALLNVVTVPIFAFWMNLGILGAGIGTVVGQVVSFVILLAMTYKGGNIPVSLRLFSFEKKYYLEMFKGGTPSLSRQGLASVSTLLLNVAAGVYGDAAIAGMSIVSRITLLVFSIIIGIGQGFQPLCGFCYGAKLYDRVRQGYKFCLKADMIFLAFVCVLGFVFAAPVVDFLRHDPEVVKVGAVALRWQIVTFPLAAFITISNMTLQTSGRSIAANILAACRNGLFFIPLILILPHFFGLKGVIVTQTVADVFSAAVGIFLILRYFSSIR